ncbi:MAG: hypothetical protein M0026_22475 [Nocardiopsaceae bacterium]|nr:hypothetical protein [Nocardiopsaceae bacterium]
MADYYGIPIPEEAQVTVQSRGTKEGRAGVKKVVEVEKGKTSEEETSESYTRPVRPVRAFNDTLDSLLQDKQIVDLTSTPDAELILNTPIQANVDLRTCLNSLRG